MLTKYENIKPTDQNQDIRKPSITYSLTEVENQAFDQNDS